MSGNHEGGLKAAQTNKDRFGNDFYVKLGAKGGKKSRTGGFYKNPEQARKIGKLGGLRGKRGYTFLRTEGRSNIYLNNKTQETVLFPMSQEEREILNK